MAGPRILVSFDDASLDAYYAGQAGFEFYDVTDPSWLSLI
jgi:hypothetical protein